jgi:uncharacterized DUF497 family protein
MSARKRKGVLANLERAVIRLEEALEVPRDAPLAVDGRTRHGRAVFVVFTIRERGGRRYIRPVSARYMHKSEIESYEKDNPGL